MHLRDLLGKKYADPRGHRPLRQLRRRGVPQRDLPVEDAGGELRRRSRQTSAWTTRSGSRSGPRSAGHSGTPTAGGREAPAVIARGEARGIGDGGAHARLRRHARLRAFFFRHPHGRLGLMLGRTARVVAARLHRVARGAVRSRRSGASTSSRARPSTTGGCRTSRRCWTDDVYRTITLRTVGLAAAVTVTDIVLAFPLAYYAARLAHPARAQRDPGRGGHPALGELPGPGVQLEADPVLAAGAGGRHAGGRHRRGRQRRAGARRQTGRLVPAGDVAALAAAIPTAWPTGPAPVRWPAAARRSCASTTRSTRR